MKPLVLTMALFLSAATYKGPFSVKVVKRGPPSAIIDVGQPVENERGLIEIEIEACGATLLFTTPKPESESNQFGDFVKEVVRKECGL